MAELYKSGMRSQLETREKVTPGWSAGIGGLGGHEPRFTLRIGKHTLALNRHETEGLIRVLRILLDDPAIQQSEAMKK